MVLRVPSVNLGIFSHLLSLGGLWRFFRETIEGDDSIFTLYINSNLSDTESIGSMGTGTMSSSIHQIPPIVLLSCLIFTHGSAESRLDAESILKRMEFAYARVVDYETSVEVRTYKQDGSFETQKFLYTFKKPNWVRLDFESPHPGMVLVYPDKDGEVGVKPAGLAHIFRFHLSSGNPLITGPSGQRIDQTDLGLLIKNISRSLTDQRQGSAEIEEDGYVRIRVLAANHFHEGVVTLYRFFIDQSLWLPVRVEESTPHGQLERSITFENLRLNTGVTDRFFRLD